MATASLWLLKLRLLADGSTTARCGWCRWDADEAAAASRNNPAQAMGTGSQKIKHLGICQN